MKKYRSDINNPKVLRLFALGGLAILGGVVFGQIKDDRFPDYADIIVAPLVVIGLYVLFWVFAVLMPITVKPEGIKCYDKKGRYKELSWSQIEEVTMMKLYGLPYACLEAQGLSSPITVPLYLGNMRDFKNSVYSFAGFHNPLSEFLRSET